MIFQIANPQDVETAILLYCAQFAHIGCGGAPVMRGSVLGCSVCSWICAFSEDYNLGQMIEYSEKFRRLIV